MSKSKSKEPNVCNWVASQVSDLVLQDYISQGLLSAAEAATCRVPMGECPPTPKDGEVIVFTDHLLRGFSPPGSKFFRDVLHFYGLHPQDLGPNSIVNLCQFQVLCEVYLQVEPSVTLFREFFYVNKQSETAKVLSLELGGVSFQRRRDTNFPAAQLPSHPKGWNKTWFYCKNTAPEDENPLPGYRPNRLSLSAVYPGWPTPEERAQVNGLCSKLGALVANGLTGIDLTRCWVSWRIMPLSRRPSLMYVYNGQTTDPQRSSPVNFTEAEADEAVRSLLKVPPTDNGKFGLAPFCASNPPPPVSVVSDV